MVRYRRIRKYGNTYIIPLYNSDIKDLDLEVGDIIDIDDIVIVNKAHPRGDNNHGVRTRKVPELNTLKGKGVKQNRVSQKKKRGLGSNSH